MIVIIVLIVIFILIIVIADARADYVLKMARLHQGQKSKADAQARIEQSRYVKEFIAKSRAKSNE